MRILYRSLGVALFVLFCMGLGSESAMASHFRYGNLSWVPLGDGVVRFDFTVAFRRTAFFGSAGDGGLAMGDIFSESTFNFGDGNTTPTLRFKVVAVSFSEDWVNAVALNPGTDDPGILHTYAGNGPYTAFYTSCCRISTLRNRHDDDELLSTVVRPNAGNRSPTSSMVPIISVAQGTASTFLVPGIDPDGDNITFRLSTTAEATGNASSDPNPPGMSINPTTGLVTWNNLTSGSGGSALSTAGPWTVQVIIEDLDGSGAVKTQNPIDFLLIINTQAGTAPTCDISPATDPLIVASGPVSFTVTGNDVDAGATVEINTGGLPAGATMTPGLPTSGAPPLSSVFYWVPSPGQIGNSYSVQFSVTDNTGQQSLCSKRIIISQDWQLPVELASFDITSIKGVVNLEWRTASEVSNAGFELYRSSEIDANKYTLVASYLSNPGMKGLGTSNTGKIYKYFDNDGLRSGTVYRYKLVDVSTDGVRTEKAFRQIRVESDEEVLYTAYRMDAITPNPANTEALISFTLAEPQKVSIEVYSADGQLVTAPIRDAVYTAGSHSETVSLQGLPAGTYMVTATMGVHARTRQLIVVR